MSRFIARLRGIYNIEAEFTRKKIKSAQVHKSTKHKRLILFILYNLRGRLQLFSLIAL